MASSRAGAFAKTIDRQLGPLVLRLIALIKNVHWLAKAKVFPVEPLRIGVLKSVALGDTILLSSVLQDLKKHHPQARLTLLAGPSNTELAQMFPFVDQVITLNLKNPITLFFQTYGLHFDWMIDADSWPRMSAIVAALTRSAWSIGFTTPGQERHFAYDQIVKHSNDMHEIENYRNLVRALAVPTESPPYNLSNKREARPFVVLHMWPGGEKSHLKEWPAESWLHLLQRWPDKNTSFCLSGGPADIQKNQDFIQRLEPTLRSTVSNHAGLSLKETLQMLAASDLVVSVNTGIMHLAASLGTPTVGLHGPTNPRRWGPIGQKTRAVTSTHPQAGCLNLGFEYLDQADLMKDLSVESVLEACAQLMQQKRSSP